MGGVRGWLMIAAPLVVAAAVAAVWYAWTGPFDDGTWFVLSTMFVFAGLMSTHLWRER